MTLDSHSELRMTTFTTFVTQACPSRTSFGGCSATPWYGITHETEGSVPSRAASKKSACGRMFSSSWSCWTVRNPAIATCEDTVRLP